MKFVKKPIVIDAIQWRTRFGDGSNNNFGEILEFCGNQCRLDTFDGLYIKTLEGELSASSGDWIIRGVKGEFYPCKPDIFHMTYTQVFDQGDQ